MVITGDPALLRIPVRTYQSVWFRAKVIFLILARHQHLVFPHPGRIPGRADWNTAAQLPWSGAARRAGVARFCGRCIIVFGRFIAYNWFDCDIQPQSAFVNWFAGCVVPPAQ